jgi:hypothetical protein
MADTHDAVENFETWSAEDLAQYLKSKCDLEDYYEMILKHDITGKVAPTLSENDLKEMGISSIGDRKRLQLAIHDLKKAARKQEREKVIWEGKEILWFSCWDACMGSCCGCCPVDPAQYKLSGTHLSIRTEKPLYCGPFRCCFGHEFDVDNVVRRLPVDYLQRRLSHVLYNCVQPSASVLSTALSLSCIITCSLMFMPCFPGSHVHYGWRCQGKRTTMLSDGAMLWQGPR